MNKTYTVYEQGYPRVKIGAVRAECLSKAVEKARKKFAGMGGIRIAWLTVSGFMTEITTNV